MNLEKDLEGMHSTARKVGGNDEDRENEKDCGQQIRR